MSILILGTDLIGKPVVAVDSGEALADIKDVVYLPDQGRLVGFTLNKRRWLGGPLKESLPWGSVEAVGRDAVMIASDDALMSKAEAPNDISDPAANRNVIGNSVITDEGTQLGEVTDVVVDVDEQGEVVGYELGGREIEGQRGGRHLFIPLPEQLAVSGQALIVPAVVRAFVRDDLSGFGAAVQEFRARLGEDRPS